MAFDRDAAVKYADRHWNIPCDDGVFWLTNDVVKIEAKRKELKAPAADGWQPMFVKGDGSEPEKAVFRRYNRLDQIKQVLLQKGAAEASLAGSGSAVFGVFPSPAMARRAAVGFPHDQTFVCETISRDRYQRAVQGARVVR